MVRRERRCQESCGKTRSTPDPEAVTDQKRDKCVSGPRAASDVALSLRKWEEKRYVPKKGVNSRQQLVVKARPLCAK